MQVVELRMDRSLLCPNFDGYKLSFDPVPVLRQNFDSNPFRLEPHVNQYSMLHLELFAKHNLLWCDPWMRYASYFMNEKHQLVQCVYDPQSGRTRGQRVVFTLDRMDHGDGYAHVPGDYNYSGIFVSERYLVICDGINTFHLIDTGDRSRTGNDMWQRISRTPVDNGLDHRGQVLYDARLDMVQERKQISLVAAHVGHRHTDATQTRRNTVHYNDLTWGRWTLSPRSDEWSYTVCQKLETIGSVLYCAFEPRAESLIIASTRDVQTPAQREAAEAAAVPPEPVIPFQNGADPAAVNFSWAQADDELSIRFPLDGEVRRPDFQIRCTASTVHVEHLGRVLIAGTLFGRVDNELTTWSFGPNKLTLIKQEPLRWPRLFIEEGTGPDESDMDADAEEADPLPDPQLPIPNLEDPVEECDVPFEDEEIKMVRFNLPAGCITHTIFMGSTPLLFNTTLRAGFPPAFSTRQGVDAALWLQMYQPTRPDEWNVRHEGQLHAFGYVQASKAERKYTVCCPNMEFVAICESYRHVLVYRARHDNAEGLRRRNGPPVVVGKQSLVTLDETVGDIIGVSTAPNLITILTEYALLHLQV
ncbi:nudC domain-containing protein 1 [Drosophila bipectinata]|uniref:nudC domain-containing protein 1 n=1 Tax=Drosophila bipectinata TaxID=42026 RepID=UPI001C89F8C0|nr:nudC domain-containing protein 1 [Drosophila bipectinata]